MRYQLSLLLTYSLSVSLLLRHPFTVPSSFAGSLRSQARSARISSKVVSTLIPSPGISVAAAYSKYGATHPLARTSRLQPASTTAKLQHRNAGGVLARLCSHLKKMTGLTARATVSVRTVCSFHILPSRWWTLYLPSVTACPNHARFLCRPRPANGKSTVSVAVQSPPSDHNRFTAACDCWQDERKSAITSQSVKVSYCLLSYTFSLARAL
jgi:hypothetical protein